jgi:hypothetical protein
VRIRRDGGALRTQATREQEFPMTARSDSVFWVDAYNAPMVFQRDSAGRPTHLVYRNRRFPKLAESPPRSAVPLSDYAGEYESDELQVRYRVEVQDGALVMQHPRHGTIALTPLWRDDFGGALWFTRSVEFQRDASGRVSGFSVFVDERSRNIRFAKRS